jgi:hypothetical protein
MARTVGEGRPHDAAAEAHFLPFHVHRHQRLRRAGDGLLEPLEISLGGDQAGDAEDHTVANEESVYRRYAIVAASDLVEGVKKLAVLHTRESAGAHPVVVPFPARSSTELAQSGASR